MPPYQRSWQVPTHLQKLLHQKGAYAVRSLFLGELMSERPSLTLFDSEPDRTVKLFFGKLMSERPLRPSPHIPVASAIAVWDFAETKCLGGGVVIEHPKALSDSGYLFGQKKWHLDLKELHRVTEVLELACKRFACLSDPDNGSAGFFIRTQDCFLIRVDGPWIEISGESPWMAYPVVDTLEEIKSLLDRAIVWLDDQMPDKAPSVMLKRKEN